MAEPTITEKDRAHPQTCLKCPLCNSARKKQKGLAFRFVKTVASSICPGCKTYEKVYGRKAHEPLPADKE